MVGKAFALFAAATLASAVTLLGVKRAESTPRSATLTDAYAVIASKRFVDLTHDFSPNIPHWKGFDPESVRTLYWYDPRPGTRGSGFFVQQFCHVGQWGTHVDPPAHFARGGRTVDQITPKEMLLPLVVLDVHDKVARNPDYVLSVDDITAWESRHGPVPAHAFVIMRTDWSKRWSGGNAAMANKDAHGVAHYPGWSLPALRYLYERRHITASGHETTDTDPGKATTHDDYSLESWILHHDHYQIELLANVDRVPEAGALAMVTFPKPKGGSGFPARVIAILP
ncbi:MAG: cyclase family protein [Candidatus Eremiobacteraeota bacterium]|nr:cyclase family protein [Candidatus Eremiobacteraeota bacterium]